MKMGRFCLFVSLLCLACLGWVRGDQPPLEPGTQPIIICGVSDPFTIIPGAMLTAERKRAQTFRVTVVGNPEHWVQGQSTMTIEATAGNDQDKVQVEVVRDIKMSPIATRRGHLKGVAVIKVTALPQPTAINDEYVQIDLKVTRTDPGYTYEPQIAHALVQLDFPTQGMTTGQKAPDGVQTTTLPPEPGTQPIIISPQPDPVPGPNPGSGTQWNLTVDVPKMKSTDQLVFRAEVDPNTPMPYADYVRLKPAIKVKVPTRPGSQYQGYRLADVSTNVGLFPHSTGPARLVLIHGVFTIYDKDGVVVTEARVSRQFLLPFGQ